MRILIVAPALEAGAADAGAVELTRILGHAGHHAIVVSNAGRLVADINAAGAEFVPLDVATANPVRILRNVFALRRLAREKRCDGSRARSAATAFMRSAAPAHGAR